jgi:hypothetical protein
MRIAAAIKPPTTSVTNKSTRPVVLLLAKGDAASDSVGVGVGVGPCAAALSSVGEGARVAVGRDVGVAGGGTGVSVAGGVTWRSSFCSGTMIELAFSPFHAINSPMSTP